MKKLIFVTTFLFASVAVFAASVPQAADLSEDQIRQIMQERLVRLVAKNNKKGALEKCQKTPQRFWFITNVGTYEYPILKGFCRAVQTLSPFVDLG